MGIGIHAEASGGRSCLVQLEVTSSALVEIEALGGSLEYVCYMVDAAGNVVASSTLQANNITHIEAGLAMNTSYEMKLFVVHNDAWYEIDLTQTENTSVISTSRITTRHQYAPEALGPVEISQDGSSVHINWSVKRATHHFASDGVRYVEILTSLYCCSMRFPF